MIGWESFFGINSPADKTREAIVMGATDTTDPEGSKKKKLSKENRVDSTTATSSFDARLQDDDERDTDHDDSGEEEEEDEEPRLKYASLTKSLSSLYRNGDATSSFLAAGDKMIVGTHNGNIHVLSVPSFHTLRLYHAHSASVSSISISPFPPPPPSSRQDIVNKLSAEENNHTVESTSGQSQSSNTPKSPRQVVIPASPSNSIYIATSSIDGNVCVASLIDPKDVLLRNFGRPVQAVALSPEYKIDKSYLSGGLSGSLVLTCGGRVGTSSNSTIMGGVAANPPSWLESIGLGANNGKDMILHSGEGAISVIKWSLSGKYVAWVNEEGIKIMRSNLHLESSDSEFSWKRMSHIDRPRRDDWDEMANVWKARAEWVDKNAMDSGDSLATGVTPPSNHTISRPNNNRGHDRAEKLVVGWGGTVWVINVFPGGAGTGKDVGERKVGSVEVATILRTDCIISGISLYTPNLLLILSYVIPGESDDESRLKKAGPQRGIRHRENGLEPELRLIDVETEEELSADTLTVRRYKNLSASDYHLGMLPPSRPSVPVAQRGTLEAIGTGLWDATLYRTRLFSSSASIRSNTSSGDRGSSLKIENPINSMRLSASDKQARELAISATAGVKIFIHSPYDCVIAVKRGLADRLSWLDSRGRYEEAWKLIEEHPEAVASTVEKTDSLPGTPTKLQGSLADFFADDGVSTLTMREAQNSMVEKEKRRIGESWLQQLVSKNDWNRAGEVCGKVLGTACRWEHWIWIFARSNRFEEITPYVPVDIKPPLPSLIYEVILGHYVSRDRARFKELLDLWPTYLFDVGSITAVIQDQLKSKLVVQGSEDWRILTDSLAKLFLAEGHYREALRCYVRLQDAEAAMGLIQQYHLLDAVAEDIPGIILIRVSMEEMKSATLAELEIATSEPINLLVREATNGIVNPEIVVSQLQAADMQLFLYFYMRALWQGQPVSVTPERVGSRMRSHHQTDAADKLVADEGRALIDRFADTVVELFAEYNRPLLMEFLQSSTSYSYSTASAICEIRHFTPELIYLLSKTGQTKPALNLILSDLKDVSQAISFAKSQDDADLWDDLLSYSMDKPEFIRALLAEAGTSIDPIKLVRRIPSGLEIEGLREGLTRMIREHDIQASISHGVARVLVGEVASRMDTLRRGQRRGIKFDIVHNGSPVLSGQPNEPGAAEGAGTLEEIPAIPPGRCAGCHELFVEGEKETLVGFACGHIFHLSHLHPSSPEAANLPLNPDAPPLLSECPQTSTYEDSSPLLPRTVGPKVTNARLLKEKIGDGCRICASSQNTRNALHQGTPIL